MAFNSFCPGSKAIKEPVPEYHPCPNCGEEVEVWTHELSYPCQKCGTRVFREQRPSCIDWCSHAKDCIGPELYDSLKPGAAADPGTSIPLDNLVKDHEETLTKLAILRALTISLKAKTDNAGDQAKHPWQTDLARINDLLTFFDNDLKVHFRREEEGLFPVMEKHIGEKGGPTGILRSEHQEFARLYESLKQSLEKITGDPDHVAASNEIYNTGAKLIGLLRGHIEKENTTLLPLGKKMLGEEEIDSLRRSFQEVVGVN